MKHLITAALFCASLITFVGCLDSPSPLGSLSADEFIELTINLSHEEREYTGEFLGFKDDKVVIIVERDMHIRCTVSDDTARIIRDRLSAEDPIELIATEYEPDKWSCELPPTW